MLYRIRHTTSLRYDGLVRLARLNLRLKPAEWPGQTLRKFELIIDPPPAKIEESAGPWIVTRHRLTLTGSLARLSIESRMEVEVDEPDPALSTAQGPAIADVREAALDHRDLSPLGPAAYLFAAPMTPPSAEIAGWAEQFLAQDRPVMEGARALMGAIHEDFTFDGTATDVRTPAQEAFKLRRGVCQDFTHIMLIAARAHGIPAAYVSGYLRTHPPKGQPRLVGADATHAWVHLWCGEDLGWVGFDPTNDMLAGSDHIFTAMGRDYADVAPVDGVLVGGAGQRMSVSVDVEPLEPVE